MITSQQKHVRNRSTVKLYIHARLEDAMLPGEYHTTENCTQMMFCLYIHTLKKQCVRSVNGNMASNLDSKQELQQKLLVMSLSRKKFRYEPNSYGEWQHTLWAAVDNMTLSGQLAGYNNGYAFLYSCSSDREVEVIGNCSCVDRGPLRLPNYMSVRKITDVKFASGQALSYTDGENSWAIHDVDQLEA
ncbi:hypothetical protein K503DRAFT_782819 [Rhizopogon vinicolor AM-OR11-026]|uniref:Uncharacterized protein n=1 Tax=Rhizopogon vinicolor AM-OR11-026 TaxID=1314800 RepID=A0A1B7N120_9AGAM|nr:hypothetical protein K503DRAFT_782819 [Rhizopogon vinicolor AM-OR11-026]